MLLPRTAPVRLPETLLVWTATLAALALLAYVLAYWTWAWLAPRPQPRTISREAPRIETANNLFGASSSGSASSQHGVAVMLVGVAAASAGRLGYSVLRVGGRRTIVVREGEEVAPGLTLSEIHADRVVLDRGGVRETLGWPARTTAVPGPVEKSR